MLINTKFTRRTPPPQTKSCAFAAGSSPQRKQEHALLSKFEGLARGGAVAVNRFFFFVRRTSLARLRDQCPKSKPRAVMCMGTSEGRFMFAAARFEVRGWFTAWCELHVRLVTVRFVLCGEFAVVWFLCPCVVSFLPGFVCPPPCCFLCNLSFLGT